MDSDSTMHEGTGIVYVWESASTTNEGSGMV